MAGLAERHCKPCSGDTPPLTPDAVQVHLGQVRDWKAIDNHHIERSFRFPDFISALEFVNRIAEIAEAEDHHPDIYLAWGKVRVTLWTHAIDGLSDNDFIVAAKIDRLCPPGSQPAGK